MKKNLAIVIPAFKGDYFELALESIAKQTCKDFTLYIGDDASPNDLELIVDKYRSEIDIFYVRFDENFGGSDLVKQWERCIDLTQEEEWIWLFSDDDIMEENCVESFYNELFLNRDLDLFHFDVKIIDQVGLIYEESQKFPKKINVEDFFFKRINNELHSFIVEYIFSKELYFRKNKFQNFDLAWCSDDATWMKFGKEKGIYTISNAFVLWRYSQVNVSSFLKEKPIVLRKLISAIQYIKWVESNFSLIKLKKSKLSKIKWILGSINNCSSFSLDFRIRIYSIVYKEMNETYNLKIILWMFLSLSIGFISKFLNINNK